MLHVRDVEQLLSIGKLHKLLYKNINILGEFLPLLNSVELTFLALLNSIGMHSVQGPRLGSLDPGRFREENK
jgi:hypothetical protein